LILDADSPLTAPESGGFSLLSYNILLPNPDGEAPSHPAEAASGPVLPAAGEGADASAEGHGWWVFKYYEPTVPEEHRTWNYRRGLLRAGLLGAGADLICLQETTADAFAADWGFLEGYDFALHRKGDIRCATFWRRDRFALAAEPQHKDRTLLTSLVSLVDPGRRLHLVNCHLKAGSDPGRRLRQVTDALEQADKAVRQLGDAAPAVVLAGDFNSNPEGSAVEQLLREGEVNPAFREADYGDLAITSKAKKQSFGRFEDAYERAYGRGQSPPTLLLPDRAGVFFDEQGALQPAIEAAIRAIFRRFAGGDGLMDRAAVERWITTINRRGGRGSEWTKAQVVFQARGAEALAEADFLAIYLAELHEGKWWGVLHDLYACGTRPVPGVRGVFGGRFDQIHFSSRTLGLAAVRAPISAERRRQVYEQGQTLPNSWHPSDHLPVGAVFRW
jgi:exonuclease III